MTCFTMKFHDFLCSNIRSDNSNNDINLLVRRIASPTADTTTPLWKWVLKIILLCLGFKWCHYHLVARTILRGTKWWHWTPKWQQEGHSIYALHCKYFSRNISGFYACPIISCSIVVLITTPGCTWLLDVMNLSSCTLFPSIVTNRC